MRYPLTLVQRSLAFVVAALMLAASCSSGTADTTSTLTVTTTASASSPEVTIPAGIAYTVENGIAYTVDSGMKLDLYSPEQPGPWPVVIVAHGHSQSQGDFRGLAGALASQGAVVFNITYDSEFPPIAGIGDIACAVRFARATAADHGGDPSRVTLVGHSQGAASGAIVGMAGDDFSGDCAVTEGSALLDGFVGYEGPYDWAVTAPPIPDLDLLYLSEEDPDLLEAINPYSHIGGNGDLIVRLIHGDDTDTRWYEVPRAVSADFHQALSEAGYDVALTLLDGASHIALANRETEAVAVTVQTVMQIAGG